MKAVRYAPGAAPHQFLIQDSAEEVVSADLRPLASEQAILFDRGRGRPVSSRGSLEIDGRLKVRMHGIGDNVPESAGHLTLSIRFEEGLEDSAAETVDESIGELGPKARDWIPTRRGVKMSGGTAAHFNYKRDTLARASPGSL